MAVTAPSPEESKRLGDVLAGLIANATDPDLKAALQARLAPQPLEPAPVLGSPEQAMQFRQTPQPVAPELAPAYRTPPPTMTPTGMSSLLAPAAPFAHASFADQFLGREPRRSQFIV